MLGKPAGEVAEQEYRRGALMLAQLVQLDPARIGGEYFRELRCLALFASGNAADVIYEQQPEQMTKEHARTLAAGQSAMAAIMMKGLDPPLEAASVGIMEFYGAGMAQENARSAMAPDAKQAMKMRAVALTLDLLREDRTELSEAEAAGVWMLIYDQTTGNPEVGLRAIQAGALGLAVEELRTASPADWVSVSRSPDGRFGSLFFAISQFIDTTPEHQQLAVVTPRLLDILLGLLKAYEAQNSPQDADVTAVMYGTGCLAMIVKVFFEFSDVNRIAVRSVASSIRYVLDHPLTQSKELGLSSNMIGVRAHSPSHLLYFAASRPCAQQGMLAAAVFGRDEDGEGAMALRQTDVDGIISHVRSLFDASYMGGSYGQYMSHIEFVLDIR